jgi:hypothetical protein
MSRLKTYHDLNLRLLKYNLHLSLTVTKRKRSRFWTTPRIVAVVLGVIVNLIWAFYLIPDVFDTAQFEGIYPFIQYLLVSIGGQLLGTLIAGPLIIGGFVYFTFNRSNMVREMMVGLAGWTFWSLFVDETLAGPFYEAPNGTILIPLSTNAQESQSSDGAFAQLWNDLGIRYVKNGGGTFMGYSWNYIFTYVVVPILGIAIALLLAIGPEIFERWRNHRHPELRRVEARLSHWWHWKRA